MSAEHRGGAITCGVPRWKRNVAQRGDALDLLTGDGLQHLRAPRLGILWTAVEGACRHN
jgi:hypothetical protein